MHTFLLIAIFGLIGIFSRYGLDRTFETTNSTWPVSTLLINILGSFVAGCIYVVSTKSALNPSLQIGLLVGFCGGFTTFSAYALQTLTMLEKGRVAPALLYLALSPVLGLLAAAIPLIVFKNLIRA